MDEKDLIEMGFPAAANIMRNEEKQSKQKMKKFKISGIYTEYIYAETKEEAIEKFDELTDFTVEPFDELVCEEMPLSHEKI
jgi:hypothetical protein